MLSFTWFYLLFVFWCQKYEDEEFLLNLSACSLLLTFIIRNSYLLRSSLSSVPSTDPSILPCIQPYIHLTIHPSCSFSSILPRLCSSPSNFSPLSSPHTRPLLSPCLFSLSCVFPPFSPPSHPFVRCIVMIGCCDSFDLCRQSSDRWLEATWGSNLALHPYSWSHF